MVIEFRGAASFFSFFSSFFLGKTRGGDGVLESTCKGDGIFMMWIEFLGSRNAARW